ncbi:site-specific integrase [Mucilaginibacter sp.]|uniref:site-specific integrase n=1 Tax=Mucilaginibacter sp. TaxID=1882438 RepID=UPI0028519034|nr:site-specific integrase [Mucilaginibacter sp.]MDR3695590.1 site-specific integrase [Mucilaginibacter sp.]
MATVKMILDKRTVKSDGTFSINFQICHNRKTTTRSSKVHVLETDWDETTKSIKKSNPLHKALNLKLKLGFAELQSQLLTADDDEVKSFLTPAPPLPAEIVEAKKTIFEFAQELITQLRADNKIGNAWVYEATVNALKEFHPDEKLYFESIDYQFLVKYNSFLANRGIKHNSIYLYVRTIRIFYNKAIKSKIVDRAYYPFDDYKLRPEKTKKRAVEIDILKSIHSVQLTPDSSIWHARNYFLLSFYLIGISIVDLSLLKKSNNKNGRIIYKRRKTGKWYDIKLQPAAIEILNYYSGNIEYLLPITNRQALNDEHLIRGIKSKTKLINKFLSQIMKLLNIDAKVTTYTARHSWATIAKKAGFSIELIAEALGHEYGNRTTAVYLDNFDQDVIDDMNEKVVQSIIK